MSLETAMRCLNSSTSWASMESIFTRSSFKSSLTVHSSLYFYKIIF